MIEPLRKSWPATAAITADFVYAFTRRYLAQQEIPEAMRHRWSEVAEWVIPVEPLRAGAERWLPQDQQEALGLIMHVRHGGAVLTDVWEGAAALVDIYDRWVAATAHHPCCTRVANVVYFHHTRRSEQKPMALNIKNPEADRLAHELAEETGETVTAAVTVALRDRLSAVRRKREREHIHAEVADLQAFVASLPDRDRRTADEILRYDEFGLPA